MSSELVPEGDTLLKEGLLVGSQLPCLLKPEVITQKLY